MAAFARRHNGRLNPSELSGEAPPARVAAWTVAGLAAVVALRAALLFRYRFDSDETQHLHVVWAWAHGLVPYRDVFDNHMPLFHILSIPLLWLFGEHPATLVLVRLAMLPLFAAIALLTYDIAARCYSRNAAIWAAVIGILAPDFFLCSIEFRPDVLWAAAWLLSIAILVRSPLTTARAAAAGFVFGIAAAVSAKTSLLALSIAVAGIAVHLLLRDRSLSGADVALRVSAFVSAALLPVASITIYFLAIGALRPFLRCTIFHNVIGSSHPLRLLYLPATAGGIVLVTRRLLRQDAALETRRRRIFIFISAFVYMAALASFWPIIQTEHWLPFYPLAAAAAVPPLLPRGRRARMLLPIAVIAAELAWIVHSAAPWRNRTVAAQALVQEAMALTRPDESVVDLKGEIVFRPRATYPVLEKLTRSALARGRLRDRLAQDVLRTHAMVAVADNPGFPPRGRAFLNRNFVRAECLRVAGKIVSGETFEIELPGDYAVVTPRGAFTGALDGIPYAGPRFLGRGRHTLVAPASIRAVIWQRAAARGETPFVTDRRCAEFFIY